MTLKPQAPAPSQCSPESLEAERIAYSQGAEAYMEWKNEHEAANSLREVRPDDGSPSCHVCGSIMVPASKGFKCFSCGEATEPTGPAPSVVESRPPKTIFDSLNDLAELLDINVWCRNHEKCPTCEVILRSLPLAADLISHREARCKPADPSPQASPEPRTSVLIPIELKNKLWAFLNRRMERDRWQSEQEMLRNGLDDCENPTREVASMFCALCHGSGKSFNLNGSCVGKCNCVRSAKDDPNSFAFQLDSRVIAPVGHLSIESAETIAVTIVEEVLKLQREGYTHYCKSNMAQMIKAGVDAALASPPQIAQSELLSEVWQTLSDVCEFHDDPKYDLDVPAMRELMKKVWAASAQPPQIAQPESERVYELEQKIRAADAVMKAIDCQVEAGLMDSRSEIADRRLDYSQPHTYAAQPSQVSAEQLERSWDSLRDLAVQIVDNSCGFTMEFSSSPSKHRSNYEWVEEKLKEVAALAATPPQPQEELYDDRHSSMQDDPEENEFAEAEATPAAVEGRLSARELAVWILTNCAAKYVNPVGYSQSPQDVIDLQIHMAEVKIAEAYASSSRAAKPSLGQKEGD